MRGLSLRLVLERLPGKPVGLVTRSHAEHGNETLRHASSVAAEIS
jgi:hypothetical protein